MHIILFVCPHHSGQFIMEAVSGEAAGAPPPTLPSVCVSEVLSARHQAGWGTVDGQQRRGKGVRAGGRGQSAQLRRGACCLCGISQCQRCQCQEERTTCQSGDVFRLGAAWSPSGTRISTQLGFLLGGGATQRQFIFWTLTWLCMPVTLGLCRRWMLLKTPV